MWGSHLTWLQVLKKVRVRGTFFEVWGSSIKEKVERINWRGDHLVGSRGNTPGGVQGAGPSGSSEVLAI